MTDEEILTAFIDTGTWKNGSPYEALSRLAAELARKDVALREANEWLSVEKDKIEFWAQQAAMWHDKYKGVLTIEDDCHRYRVALERIAKADNTVPKDRVRLIARHALGEAKEKNNG